MPKPYRWTKIYILCDGEIHNFNISQDKNGPLCVPKQFIQQTTDQTSDTATNQERTGSIHSHKSHEPNTTDGNKLENLMPELDTGSHVDEDIMFLFDQYSTGYNGDSDLTNWDFVYEKK